jgi:hypothetical protein
MFTSTPLYFVFRHNHIINPSFYIAIVFIVIGIIGEAVADN